MHNQYCEERKDLLYYKKVKAYLAIASLNANSILDVGSNGIDVMTFLPCSIKVSLDKQNPLEAEGVESIRDDFITHDFRETKYDIVSCLQTLEHIDDEYVDLFAEKLLQLGKIVIISVPFKWTKGACKWHKQDPVDIEKVEHWMGRKAVISEIVREIDGTPRLIMIFINEKMTEDVIGNK